MAEQLTGMMTENEFLEHAGVKGMKWGKRKAKGPASADAARYNKIRKRVKKSGLDNLSNDDLAKLNKRNQLLTEYKRNNPSALQVGLNATKNVIATVGTITAAASLAKKAVTVLQGASAVATIVGKS